MACLNADGTCESERVCLLPHAQAHHYVELMKNILGRFSMELDSYLPSLTALDGPDAVMLDGYLLTNQGTEKLLCRPIYQARKH